VASPAEHQNLYDAIRIGKYFDVGKYLAKDVVFDLEFEGVEISGYTMDHAASVLSTPEIAALIKAYEKDPNGIRAMAKTREGLISFLRTKFGSSHPVPK
jgi:hypothetical protein